MHQEEYERMFNMEQDLWWYRGLRGFLKAEVDGVCGRRRDVAILDVGCGTGINLEMLRQYGRAGGMDFSEDALQYCRQRNLDDLVRGSALRLPYADESFDLVTCMDVLGHSSITCDVDAVREIFRTLRPGGSLMIHVAALDCLRGQHDEVIMFSRRYSKSAIRDLMIRGGFRIQRLTFRNMIFFPILLLHRQLSRITRGNKAAAESDLQLPHPVINGIMSKLTQFENAIARKVNLPLGSSLYCLAERPY